MERMEGLRSYKTGNGRRVTIIIMEFNFLHRKGGHFDILQCFTVAGDFKGKESIKAGPFGRYDSVSFCLLCDIRNYNERGS